MMQYQFSCVSCPKNKLEALRQMCADGRNITYRTFKKHCDVDEWAASVGYVKGSKPSLRNDWAVHFYKSKFDGKPCYYIRWSAYEFVWV